MNTMTQENQMLAHMSASEHQTNHVLHLILTLTTFGLWSFVWLFVASSNMKQRNKIKSNAGMSTQFNFPRLLLWINFTWWALFILLMVAAGDAKAEASVYEKNNGTLEAQAVPGGVKFSIISNNEDSACMIDGLATTIDNHRAAYTPQDRDDSCVVLLDFNKNGSANVTTKDCNGHCGLQAAGTMDGTYIYK